MEDLDQPRVVPGSAQEIIQQLRWLGLEWAEGPDVGGPAGPYIQSQRTPYYAQAFDYLRQQGLVYPCFCSRKDIQNAASAPHGAEAPIYPGTCRNVAVEQIPELIAQTGRQPAWRFRVSDTALVYNDLVLGKQRQDVVTETGDFVVLRRDGLFAYQLAVVVDDALMGITDVLRGADLVPSTPRQIVLYRALGITPPRFWHVPLMTDLDGNRLAKRDGSDLPVNVELMDPSVLRNELLGSVGFTKLQLGRSLSTLVDHISREEFLGNLRSGARSG